MFVPFASQWALTENEKPIEGKIPYSIGMITIQEDNLPASPASPAAERATGQSKWQAREAMIMRRIHVQGISVATIIVTIVLGTVCAATFVAGWNQFQALHAETETYISSEKNATQLQTGSNTLTEQVRLAAMTGEEKYVDAYFQEANVTQSREQALSSLKEEFKGTDAFNSLQAAMDESNDLMLTEYHAMRLVEEANGSSAQSKYPELQEVQLTDEEAALSNEEKLARAQDLVSNQHYEAARTNIKYQTNLCISELTTSTRNSQNHAATAFKDVYLKLEIFVILFAIFTLLACFLVRKSIVKPIMTFNERIRTGAEFPVTGAGELQVLAETYNQVREENEATQMLIKHQAEHDALTDLLNRGSYDKLLDLYEASGRPFALILLDVDIFKHVNDTYGHAAGDAILKRVASLLKTAFRSIDHICRTGGDEFAIIMVEMTPDLRYTIQEKIDAVNEQLAQAEAGLPKVSLSVGVAFSERENPGESIYKDADLALYRTKENGRNGCTFFEDL